MWSLFAIFVNLLISCKCLDVTLIPDQQYVIENSSFSIKCDYQLGDAQRPYSLLFIKDGNEFLRVITDINGNVTKISTTNSAFINATITDTKNMTATIVSPNHAAEGVYNCTIIAKTVTGVDIDNSVAKRLRLYSPSKLSNFDVTPNFKTDSIIKSKCNYTLSPYDTNITVIIDKTVNRTKGTSRIRLATYDISNRKVQTYNITKNITAGPDGIVIDVQDTKRNAEGNYSCALIYTRPDVKNENITKYAESHSNHLRMSLSVLILSFLFILLQRIKM